MATNYDKQVLDETFDTQLRESGVSGLAKLSDIISMIATADANAAVASAVTVRKVAVPATATSAGAVGDIAFDASFLYVCYATNTWRRVAIVAW